MHKSSSPSPSKTVSPSSIRPRSDAFPFEQESHVLYARPGIRPKKEQQKLRKKKRRAKIGICILS